MWGSDIIDVAIGIICFFLLLSLVCSAAIELIEAVLKYRARDLERGIGELLGDPHFIGMVNEVYNHPLVNGLFPGPYPPLTKRRLPTYIPSRTFAIALMDVIAPASPTAPSGAAATTLPQVPNIPAAVPNGGFLGTINSPATTAALRTSIVGLASSPARTALLSLVDAAGHDPAAARQNIEYWYNASMDRVSGWFKRRTQAFLFILGIILAVVTNADAIGFARYLSTDKAARTLIVSQAQTSLLNGAATPVPDKTSSPHHAPTQSPIRRAVGGAAATRSAPGATGQPSGTPVPSGIAPPAPDELLNSLAWLDRHSGVPFGWHFAPDVATNASDPALYKRQLTEYNADWRRLPMDWGEWIVKIAGLLLTGCAVTLGAPLWFDVLNKFMVVRSTIKPKDKSPDKPSKA